MSATNCKVVIEGKGKTAELVIRMALQHEGYMTDKGNRVLGTSGGRIACIDEQGNTWQSNVTTYCIGDRKGNTAPAPAIQGNAIEGLDMNSLINALAQRGFKVTKS